MHVCPMLVYYPKMGSDTFLSKNLGYVLVVLNLSIPEIIGVDDSVMTSSREPQCCRDIIMRTPRITGKPRFSCSRGPKTP